jgi:MOSC domain-containing protein YiiM
MTADHAVEPADHVLDSILSAPADDGVLELIVRRPAVDEREVLDEGLLDVDEGLVGDSWRARGSGRTDDGGPHPGMQVTITNVRVLAHLAASRDEWPLAGDQLYVDLDLGYDNLPPGTRLAIGEAVLEVSDQPHTGCAKYRRRFGPVATELVNSEVGRRHNLRGINARVVTGGAVHPGDRVRKVG